MNIIFMGTMDFAVPILQGLIDSENVMMVVTQPDRPFGRKRILKSSSVKLLAEKYHIPVFQPERIKVDYQPILDLHPDIIIVAAYGQMIPDVVLYTPKFKCVNVHASLLPKLRGGAPMHKAIQYGENITGVSIIFMEKKMDSGDILFQAECPILDTDDVGSLQTKLGLLGKDALLHTLPLIFSGEIVPRKQDLSKVTFAYNIKPEEEHLDLKLSSREVYNHIRAYRPWPLVYVMIDDLMMKIIRASIINESSMVSNVPGEIVEVSKNRCYVQTGKGIISLDHVQLQGKNPMDISSFLNGYGKTLLTVGKILK